MMQRLKSPEPLLPDIPSAPIKKHFISAFDIDYQKRKRLLASRLPVLKPEDLVGRTKKPSPPLDLASACMGYANLAEYVNRWFRRDQTNSSNELEEDELELNFLHDTGHWLLEEGHLWEAEECYALAYENFRFPSEGEQFEDYPYNLKKVTSTDGGAKKPGVASPDPDNDEIEQKRLDVAWAMYGVAAGQNLWSRLAGLCRSGRQEDIRSVIRFKCSRKQLRAVRRPNYSTEDVTGINKPWEISGLEIDIERIPESEASWQAGFLNALKSNRKKKRVYKVGFGAIPVEETSFEITSSTPSTTDSKTGVRRPRARSVRTDTEMDRFEDIMKGMDDLTKGPAEVHATNPRQSTHTDWADTQMDRIKRMTESVAAFSSTSKIKDLMPSIQETEEEEEEEDEEDDELN